MRVELGDVTLEAETDPFELLRLGTYARSCLAPGASNSANAVAVGSNGNVALTGISNDDAWTVRLAAATGALDWQRRYGSAGKFDGSRGVGIDANNDIIISAYTQSAWIKPAVLGARGIVGWGNYGASRQVNALRLADRGNAFRHYWWGADLDTPVLATNFINGSWHHVAWTLDRQDGATLFLDGKAIDTSVEKTICGLGCSDFSTARRFSY